MRFLTIFFLMYYLTISCGQKRTYNSIIGKWKLIAESGSNGTEMYTNEIKNGEILSFEPQNMIRNEKGEKGSYELLDNKLKIQLKGLDRYYLLFYDDDKSNTIYLNPVTPKYEIICDEGCSFTYRKL